MNREIKEILVACAEELWTVNLAARATAILDRETAKRRRKKARTLPRRKAEKASRQSRAERSEEIRAFVMGRANGRCELCGNSSTMLDWHHLAPAALRRRLESCESTVAACLGCHWRWHHNDVEILERSYQTARLLGAPRVVLDSIRRRIDKVTP